MKYRNLIIILIASVFVPLIAEIVDLYFYFQYLDTKGLSYFGWDEFGVRLGYITTFYGWFFTAVGTLPLIALYLYLRFGIRRSLI